MSTLHIVSKSPYRTDALQRCLALVAPGDSIILIEDGVFGVNLLTPDLKALEEGIRCYALSEDLAARGLSAAAAGIRPTDYAGFVVLVCEHRNSLSHG
ncbi:MAG: sulfurtransferase complex subunit TusB [Pseudohongiella sp.]